MSSNIASTEDVYNWLIDSITYALHHKAWRNPKSSIYNDPNGPDKVINRQIRCRRYTAYQSFNRYKRKPQYTDMSLDDINDEDLSLRADIMTEDVGNDVINEITIHNIIKTCFENQ